MARALGAAVSHLVSQQREDGGFEGHLDGGVLFPSALIVLKRAAQALAARPEQERTPQGAQRTEEEDLRELELARHILTEQLPGGLFRAYPDGPPSREGTRLAALALRRVLRENRARGAQAQALRAELHRALTCAKRALRGSDPRPRELVFQRGFRQVLEAIDRAHRARAEQPLLPDPRAFALPSVLFAPAVLATRARLDGRLFPFLTVLAPLLMLIGNQLRARSAAGVLVRDLLARAHLTRVAAQSKANTAQLVDFLISHQDQSGGFFYSAVYTQLFITALGALPAEELTRERAARVEAALTRARGYVQSQEISTGDGTAVRLLGSDLWDSVSLGLAALAGDRAPVLPAPTLESLVRFVLRCQMPDGGWSFGRLARFTDSDTTGWACALLARVRRRGLLSHLHAEIAQALCAGVDLMHRQVGPSGGFGAWGKNRLQKKPGTVSEWESLALDLPTEEVTGRALYALAELQQLCACDEDFRRLFGEPRRRRVASLVTGAVGFMAAQRDPATGLWPARWSLGYLPGSAFALGGLCRHRFPLLPAYLSQATATVLAAQNEDGGFGESDQTDREGRFLPSPRSTVVHTASALQILADCGVPHEHPAFQAGLRFLLQRQHADGSWSDESVYTCFTGYYYRYHLMTQAAALAVLARVHEAPQSEHPPKDPR